MKSKTITITDTKILKFLYNNPEKDIQVLVSRCIDIYDYVVNLSRDNSDNIIKYILDQNIEIKDLKNKLDTLASNNNVNNSLLIETLKNNNNQIIREYISDIKENNKENADLSLQKIILYIKETISKISPDLKIDEHLYKLQQDLQTNTKLNSKELEQTILEQYNSSMTKIIDKLSELNMDISETKFHQKENTDIIKNTHEIIQNFNAKNNNSTIKGKLGEEKLLNLLNSHLNTTEVICSTKQKMKGDFILKKDNLPDILIDTKEYSSNVGKCEIDKFIRDVNQNNCCGILMSQTSGICNKENFEINFHNNNVVLYLHNVTYDIYVIKTAINIIYKLYDKIKDKSREFTIDEDTILAITTEYNGFINKRNLFIKGFKEQYKQNLSFLESLDLPKIDLYLNLEKIKSEYKCSICYKEYNNTRSLNSHMKIHNK